MLVVLGRNPPAPDVVQLVVVAPPPIVPLKLSVGLFEQIFWLVPALIIASFLIVTATVLLTAGQAPLLVELIVKITEPAVISAAVKL